MNDDRAREDSRRPGHYLATTEARPPTRLPPHDHAAEEALVGAALLHRSALEILATRTTPGDFYDPGLALIADTLGRAFAEGWDPDPVTVAAELRRTGMLDRAGGAARLVSIMGAAPSTSAAPRYAEIIHDHATLRRLLGAAGEIAELGYGNRGHDAHDAVLRAQEVLGGVASQNGARSYSSLDVADVAALLEGDLEPEEPDFLRRVDGKALFYAGKMHVLQAEPSSGKSWLALLACAQILEVGGSVVYLDYEDTPTGILGRVLALGADPVAVRNRFVYVRPVGPFGPAEKTELARLLETLNPDLAVIDGVAEALTRDGYSEDKASEVVSWVEKLPRWLARTGAAVVMLDHVVKDREQQGRWARGSGAKLGAVDGATYHVKVTEAFSRHRSGTLKLVIAKDRPGGVGAIGETAAVAKIEPHADGARVNVTLDGDHGQAIPRAHRPTLIMQRVSEMLETRDLTATALKALVSTQKPRYVEIAIETLIFEGYIRRRGGKSSDLVLVKPYHGDDSTPPDPEAPPPTLYEVDGETVDTSELTDRPPDPPATTDHDPDLF